jgi:hypothetical protein
MIRLLSVERRDWVTFRNYWHPTRGIVQTCVLTAEPHVLHVTGPNFGAGGEPRQTRLKSRRRTQRRAGHAR